MKKILKENFGNNGTVSRRLSIIPKLKKQDASGQKCEKSRQ